MKIQPFLITLTLANTALLVFSLQPRGTAAQDAAPALRCRSLELVDDHGRVRAEIKVHAAQPDLKMPDGAKGYPETVLLRLFSSKGAPNVKLAATEDGSGMVLGGESNSYVQILSRGANPFIKVLNKDGEQTIKP